PKVIPANTIVITNTETMNLFCLRIWDISDHILEFKEVEESSVWFMRPINSFQKTPLIDNRHMSVELINIQDYRIGYGTIRSCI
ncbi:MAG: hypothetical protein ACXAB5_07700, partial [Candidatus Thorarchaeota archaeon]